MEQELITLWEMSKDNIRTRLWNEYDNIQEYKDLLIIMLTEFAKTMEEDLDIEDFHICEHSIGDYTGDIIFIYMLGYTRWWHCDIYICNIQYGSCSGCDSLLAALAYKNKEASVEALLSLCLHVLLL
jgi:hypothetical protein